MPLCCRAFTFAIGASLCSWPVLAQELKPGGSSAKPGMAEMQSKPSHASSPADEAMMAGMQKMRQDMGNAPMSGDPDRDFVAMMIPHHQGAIDMARVELRYGKDPMLRRLSQAIVAAQAKEITVMQHWQIDHPPAH